MKRNISVDNQSYQADYPDECPICHHHSEITVLKAQSVRGKSEVQVVFQCGYTGCWSFFIGYYGPTGASELKAVKPISALIAQFPQVVVDLSPSFVSIYQEAEEAAQVGMSQIAGPGYRKAFKFLIKDYAKSLAPEKAGEIEKAFSGSVVTDFISDPRVQAVAKRTLWLGNDETHYLKKWAAHDLKDLMTLIKITVNFIEMEQLSRNYIANMPE